MEKLYTFSKTTTTTTHTQTNKQTKNPGAPVAHIVNSLLQNSDLKILGKATKSFRYDINQIEETKRFKGLILIDRVLEEPWTMVYNIVQEVVTKNISKKKKCNKAKWFSEEALQIVEKRREAKGKGGKERYIHPNAVFQRILRREKKAFLSDQCKEIEGNNRMGKTRDVFKKIRDTKGIFQAKMSTIKDRNCMDLKKEKILRRGGKNTL